MITLQRAASGRAGCHASGCSDRIPRGEWRVGVRGSGRYIRWFHLECFMSQYGIEFMHGLIPILTDEQLRAVGLEVEHIEPDDSSMMPDPEPVSDSPFSVGDLIRVRADRVGTICEYGGEFEQWEGEVITATGSGVITVNFNGGPRWSVSPDEIEHVSPEPEPEPHPEPPSDPDLDWWRSLQPGDMVRVTDVETHPGEYHMGIFTVGEELEVVSVNRESRSGADIVIRRNDNGETWYIQQDSVERV